MAVARLHLELAHGRGEALRALLHVVESASSTNATHLARHKAALFALLARTPLVREVIPENRVNPETGAGAQVPIIL